MKKLLFEIGTEEMPANYMPGILIQLQELATKKLQALADKHGMGGGMGCCCMGGGMGGGKGGCGMMGGHGDGKSGGKGGCGMMGGHGAKDGEDAAGGHAGHGKQ